MAGEFNFNRDGHPTYLSRNCLLVTDTYPDEYDNCKLICYDLKADSLVLEESFNHNTIATRTPFRADLHPKVFNDGKIIVVDTFDTCRRVQIFK